MPKRLAGLFALAFLSVTGTATAQTRPDFSGTWSAITDAAATGPDKPAAPALGAQFSIVHKDRSLTLTRTLSGTPTSIPYELDGREVATRVPGRLCEPDSGATWTAAWDGDTIVLSTVSVTAPNGKTTRSELRTTLRLESPGQLRVETTAGAASQPTPRTTSTLYKRTGDAPAPTSIATATANAKATMADVAWIAGSWAGTAGANTYEERWTPPAAGSMMAVSRTLRDTVMTEFEFLCIVERNSGLVYSAMPNGRMPATDFTLTKIEKGTAVFENPAHDYPQMIQYKLGSDGSLEATISGSHGKNPRTFHFTKVQPVQ
jgi:hypothetical protein